MLKPKNNGATLRGTISTSAIAVRTWEILPPYSSLQGKAWQLPAMLIVPLTELAPQHILALLVSSSR